MTFYKIGMELTYAGGLPLVSELARAGKKVFLDLKLHDIPNTVARATEQVAELGATFLTVHAYPADHEGGGGRGEGLAPEAARGHGDDELRRCGPRRRRASPSA